MLIPSIPVFTPGGQLPGIPEAICVPPKPGSLPSQPHLRRSPPHLLETTAYHTALILKSDGSRRKNRHNTAMQLDFDLKSGAKKRACSSPGHPEPGGPERRGIDAEDPGASGIRGWRRGLGGRRGVKPAQAVVGSCLFHIEGCILPTRMRNVCKSGGAVAGEMKFADGAQVQVFGQITVYEARGNYQIIVRRVRERGVGALQAKFEELKRRLAEEGLFSPERKRTLPRFPRRIGVVTSHRRCHPGFSQCPAPSSERD